MKAFEYIYPKDVKSVPAVLGEYEGKALLYAGGTDALARIKEGIDRPEHVVNLKGLDELNSIWDDKDGLQIGAGTLLSTIANSDVVKQYGGLAKAVETVGTIQLRNMGTLGGNLCQRPRCWYYRSRHFDCVRKGGDVCFAISGDNKYHAILGGFPCYIVYPSDVAPILITLGAEIEILGPQGTKRVPLEDFYILPEKDATRENILNPDEIVTKVIIPKKAKQLKSHYLKFKERDSFDFAMVSVAVAGKVSGNKISDLKIAMGGVAPKPWRAFKAEKVLDGKTITDDLLKRAGEAELKDAEPLEQNEYKITLTKNLLKRAVGELLAE